MPTHINGSFARLCLKGIGLLSENGLETWNQARFAQSINNTFLRELHRQIDQN